MADKHLKLNDTLDDKSNKMIDYVTAIKFMNRH